MDNTETRETAVELGHTDDKMSSKATASTESPFFMESAALLALWSVLVINEGAIRFIGSNPEGGVTRGGRPPVIIFFLGGLFEVVFGLFGLFVGVGALVFRYYNTFLTKACIATQVLFGYYVFFVFVFIQPIYRAVDLTDEGLLPGVSISQMRFLITMGIFTSFHFCLALQGGQFVFMARLICAGTGRDFLRQNSGNKMRAIFWNANFALSGLWTLITGIVVSTAVGSGTLDVVYEFAPNVGRMPGYTISTGALMILYGLAGIGVVLMNMRPPAFFYLAGAYVYLFALLNFGILQFGRLPQDGGAPSGPVALHNGLVFMVVFLGPYFVRQWHKSTQQKVI